MSFGDPSLRRVRQILYEFLLPRWSLRGEDWEETVGIGARVPVSTEGTACEYDTNGVVIGPTSTDEG